MIFMVSGPIFFAKALYQAAVHSVVCAGWWTCINLVFWDSCLMDFRCSHRSIAQLLKCPHPHWVTVCHLTLPELWTEKCFPKIHPVSAVFLEEYCKPLLMKGGLQTKEFAGVWFIGLKERRKTQFARKCTMMYHTVMKAVIFIYTYGNIHTINRTLPSSHYPIYLI